MGAPFADLKVVFKTANRRVEFAEWTVQFTQGLFKIPEQTICMQFEIRPKIVQQISRNLSEIVRITESIAIILEHLINLRRLSGRSTP